MTYVAHFLAKNWALLITVLSGPVLTLIGVRITLAHSRKQQLIQLRENFATTIRAEKRQIYVEYLQAIRSSMREVSMMGQASLGAQLAADVEGLAAASERFRELQGELDIVASPEVLTLAEQIYRANGACLDVLYRETEKRNPQPGVHTQQQLEGIWDDVRAEIQKEFDRQGIERLYQEFQNQVRKELGFIALDLNLIPSEREQRRLKKDLERLD